MTYGRKRSRALLKGKDKGVKGEVNKKTKYKQERKEASYKKQKEANDKRIKHTNNLYSADIYIFSSAC